MTYGDELHTARLDAELVARGLMPGRDRAKEAINAGRVRVNGSEIRKASFIVTQNDFITLSGEGEDYASRAGDKLAHALDYFGINCTGYTCVDAGASTGGFTDCLLRRGAAHVFAVDVGHAQLAADLRGDARVTCMENTDIRTVTTEKIGGKVDFITADLSFISLSPVMPALRGLLAERGQAVLLVKPQFEAGRGNIGSRGIVRDEKTHIRVLKRFMEDAQLSGFHIAGLTHCGIRGREGNIEFISHLTRSPIKNESGKPDAEEIVRAAHRATR